MNNRIMCVLLIGIGMLLIVSGIYTVSTSSEKSSSFVKSNSVSTNFAPNCVVSYSSGACWTINNPPKEKPERISSDATFNKPDVQISNN